jgi:hypothetical protein
MVFDAASAANPEYTTRASGGHSRQAMRVRGSFHTHLVRGGSVMVKPTNEWIGRAYPPRESWVLMR